MGLVQDFFYVYFQTACCIKSPCPCCRFGLHDDEHVGTLCRAEGSAADTPAEGEWHPLRYLPLLLRRQRQQPPRTPERLHQGEQQSHGDACVERVRLGHPLLGTGGTSRQHLLAQLLPGEETQSHPTFFSLHNVSSQNEVAHCKQPFITKPKSLKPASRGGARKMYYLRMSKQLHNGLFKTPTIIDFWGYRCIHGNLFSLPATWARSLFPILKTHFHFPMHMTAGRGNVISHLPGY